MPASIYSQLLGSQRSFRAYNPDGRIIQCHQILVDPVGLIGSWRRRYPKIARKANSGLCLSPPGIYVTMSGVSCMQGKVVVYCTSRLNRSLSILCVSPIFCCVSVGCWIFWVGRKMRNIVCFLGVYAIFLCSLASSCVFACLVMDRVVIGLGLEVCFFASCL